MVIVCTTPITKRKSAAFLKKRRHEERKINTPPIHFPKVKSPALVSRINRIAEIRDILCIHTYEKDKGRAPIQDQEHTHARANI